MTPDQSTNLENAPMQCGTGSNIKLYCLFLAKDSKGPLVRRPGRAVEMNIWHSCRIVDPKGPL
jgi:hypothetical protein